MIVTGPRRWPFLTDAPGHSICYTLMNPQCSMAISAEHRSTCAALHRSLWRIHINETFWGGLKTQTNKETILSMYETFIKKYCIHQLTKVYILMTLRQRTQFTTMTSEPRFTALTGSRFNVTVTTVDIRTRSGAVGSIIPRFRTTFNTWKNILS